MNRRLMLRRALVGASALAVGAFAAVTSRAQDGVAVRTIAMTAKRFEYVPNDIALKVGEKVVLAVTSVDFIHGLSIPDLGIRADLVPGRVTRIEIQPKQVGIMEFVCDNFCGDHHEEMHGRFVVSAE